MSTLGLQALDTIGRPVYVLAEQSDADWFPRGITIDWGLVAAVGVDTTLRDDTVVKNGSKYLRFGQVMTRVGTAEIQTYEWTGGPTSGSAILTFPAWPGGFQPEVTVALPFNETAANVQAALQALPHIGPNGVTVTRAGAGSAGSPYVYTATYARQLGDVGTPTATHTFLGGTTPTVTIATSQAGVGTGKFGPYDPAANDGRQTLSRGDCCVLNSTELENEVASDLRSGLTGGLFFKQRILMTTGTHSLAAGPTVAEFETAFPDVAYA